uniref:RNA polymerase beta' subunit n=1 Tax=Parallela transversalis TaxID=163324 RepID=UPI0010C4E541|nr:RNA polymerase beta' subunit [Parallela transversalis]AYQ22909.1 RNA polymerase beta' subunit [Parallela transversalis]
MLIIFFLYRKILFTTLLLKILGEKNFNTMEIKSFSFFYRLLPNKPYKTRSNSLDFTSYYNVRKNKKNLASFAKQIKTHSSYSKLSEINQISIHLASPERIRFWAQKVLPNGKILGRVTNANTLHYKTFKPQKGGLFCERIFGPIKDFECACGKSKKMIKKTSLLNLEKETSFDTERTQAKNLSQKSLDSLTKTNSSLISTKPSEMTLQGDDQTASDKITAIHSFTNLRSLNSTESSSREEKKTEFCPNCDVEYTWSIIRRYQLGYIQLVAPVSHLWYLKGTPSYLSILLNLKKRDLESILYSSESMSLEAAWYQKSLIYQSPSNLFMSWQKLLKNEKALTPSSFEKKIPSTTTQKSNLKRVNKQIPERLENWRLEEKESLISPLPSHLVELDKKEIEENKVSELDVLLSKTQIRQGDQSVFDVKNLSIPLYILSKLKQVGKKKFFLQLIQEIWKNFYKKSYLLAYRKAFQILKFTKLSYPKLPFLNSLDEERQFVLEREDFKSTEAEQRLKEIMKSEKRNLLKTLFPTKFPIFRKNQIRLIKQRELLKIENKEKITKNYFQKKIKIISRNLLLKNKNHKKFMYHLKHANKLFSKGQLHPQLLTKAKFRYLKLFKRSNREFSLSRKERIKLYFKIHVLKSIKKWNQSKFELFSLLKEEQDLNLNSDLVLLFSLLNLTKKRFNLTASLNLRYLDIDNIFLLVAKDLTKAILQEAKFLINLFSKELIRNIVLGLIKSSSKNVILGKERFGSLFFSKKKEILTSSQKKSWEKSNLISNAQPVLNLEKNLARQIFNDEITMKNQPSLSFAWYKANKLNQQITDQGNKFLKRFSVLKFFKNQLLDLSPFFKKDSKIFWTNFTQLINWCRRKSVEQISESIVIFRNKKVNSLIKKLEESLKTKPHAFLTREIGGFSFSMVCSAGLTKEKKQALNLRRKILDFKLKNLKTYYKILSSKKSDFGKILEEKTIFNNIYLLSHRFIWKKEKDWRSFFFYVSAFPDFIDLPISYYQNRIPNNESVNLIGAGIIQRLLSELNIDELKKVDKQNRIVLYEFTKEITQLKRFIRVGLADKSDESKYKELIQERDKLIRHLKLTRVLYQKKSNPESMILSTLPVLPPDLRPIMKLEGQVAASDLNRFYQRILYRNERLQKFLKDPATRYSYEMKFTQRLLQESVDNLISNGKGKVVAEKDSRGRPLKSLSDILKGKEGRFRQHLLGKRVDYSGRSVIVVGPRLKIHQCGLPKEIALELFLPFLLKGLIHGKMARSVRGAKTILRTNPSLSLQILTEVMQNHPIFLNRAPTLHRLGIQAFQAKLVEGRAILLHPLVCPAFNADFDGDQMAVHLPITVEARAEAWKLMFSRANLLSPATGDPILLPSQDMVLGCYYLTTLKSNLLTNTKESRTLIRNQNLTKESHLYFSNLQEVLRAYYQKSLPQKLDLHSIIWLKYSANLSSLSSQQKKEKKLISSTSIQLTQISAIEESNAKESFSYLFENDHSNEEPNEIHLNQNGYWKEISPKIQQNFDPNNILVSRYMRTTVGRILFNSIIQDCLDKFI